MDADLSPMTNHNPLSKKRRLLAAGLILALIAGLALASLMLGDQHMFSKAWVSGVVSTLGPFGPLALIGLMTLAIVASPIPSGPIAMAAGALYGTTWGTVYSVTGAVLGAVIAFCLARYLGHSAIRQSDNRILKYIAAPRSQWSLMAIVFASRLIPFISFDAISYAAGLTAITFARFAIATIAGVIPVTIALAAMGAGLHDQTINPMLLALIGGITLLPVIVKWLWDRIRPGP
jgi:uncharacterized membrane protein YdjX (TVP38/TMEM64 family)